MNLDKFTKHQLWKTIQTERDNFAVASEIIKELKAESDDWQSTVQMERETIAKLRAHRDRLLDERDVLQARVEFADQSKSVTIKELENELQAIKAFNDDGILVRS